MRKLFKWLKNNKLATFVIVCLTWVVHYSIETIIVQNILKLAGLGIPLMVI